MSAAANLDTPVTIDGVFAQIRAVMVERDRLRDSIERAAAALGLHDAANGDPASIIAKCRRALGAGPGETLLEACTRVAQRQPRPAPLTPERAAVLDDAAEAAPRMLAAIQGQARDGESPDQTVERLIWERRFLESQHDLFKRASDIDGEILDAIRAALGTPEGVDVTEHARAVAADLRRTEHDLARLMVLVRADGCEWEDVQTLCDEIEERGAPGWLERALSDETAEPVRQERETWEARVSEAVQEGERRIDAIDRQHVALLATVQAAIPAIHSGINALGSSEVDVRSRNAARDSLHALEAAVEGQEPPAAVLSAAELEALAGVAMAAEWAAHCDCEGGACRRDLRNQVQRWISAGRPLASEGAA